jgi:hypothetical protein
MANPDKGTGLTPVRSATGLAALDVEKLGHTVLQKAINGSH